MHSSVMDCTRPMSYLGVSLCHPSLLLCLQITVLLLHIHDGLGTRSAHMRTQEIETEIEISHLLNLVVLADETHPTGLQLTQFISNLM